MSTRLRWSIAFLVLLVGSYVAWVGASAWQASKVSISSTELVECQDPRSLVASSERVTDALEDGAPVHVIRVDESLDCLLRSEVVSRAAAPVRVQRLTWPNFGAESGTGVQLTWADDIAPQLVDDDFARRHDAVFDLRHRGSLEDERTPLIVHATFNGRCKPPGSEGFVSDSPTAAIRVLGRTHTIRATGAGVGYQGNAGCDS